MQSELHVHSGYDEQSSWNVAAFEDTDIHAPKRPIWGERVSYNERDYAQIMREGGLLWPIQASIHGSRKYTYLACAS
jgi:hypothetical protein